MAKRPWTGKLLIIACAAMAVAGFQDFSSASGGTVEKARAAWRERNGAVKSLQYEATLSRAIAIPANGSERDPFGGSNPNHAIGARDERNTLIFCVSGDRIAMRQSKANGGLVPQEAQRAAAFDGKVSRTLTRGDAPLVVGQIEANGKPDSLLTVYIHEVAFYLGYSPEAILDQVGCDVAKLVLGQPNVDVGGRACIELLTSRKIKSPWIERIYVDPARDFVPVLWIQEWNGVVLHDIAVEYNRNERIGWVVASWTNRQFTEQGKLNDTTKGKVNRCVVNEPLAEATFELKFPVGAHVVDEPNSPNPKYYTQGENGKPIPTTEKE